MKIGKFRHLISVIDYEISVNEFGEEEKTEIEVAKLWAKITPLKSNEFFAQGTNLLTTHRIIVRYTDLINAKQKIKFENREFEITGIRDFFEGHRFLEILAKELNGD